MLKCDQPEKPRKTYVIPKVSKKRAAQIASGEWKPKPPKPIAKSQTKINQVSKSKKSDLQKYEIAKAEYLKGKTCEFPGCGCEDVTLHHKKGRIGALLYDKRFFAALCIEHHMFVELNPNEAKSLKLSLSRLSNN